MDGDTRAGGPAMTEAHDPEQLREEIEATREELGDTVEALSAKTDVKAQAKRKVEETKASVNEKKDELLGKARQASPETVATVAGDATQKVRQNPLPVAVAGAFAVGFVAGRVTSR